MNCNTHTHTHAHTHSREGRGGAAASEGDTGDLQRAEGADAAGSRGVHGSRL